MKLSTSLLFTACCLSACCHPGTSRVSTTAPYNGIAPVSAKSFSRAYVQVMSASGLWQKSKDHEVIVCGALGELAFKPGVTVDEAIKSIHNAPFYSSFYNVAVWRPKTAALYGVLFRPKRSAEPSVRTLISSECLLAGDIIIILERALSF